MECDDTAKVAACANNVNNNIQDIANENNDQISAMDPSCFLTASDLCSIRGNMYKSKNKDEDVELYKGPKLYYPSENPCSEEIVEGIMDDQKKSLELQLAVKCRDCIKAEWNEELQVAIVPYLKGKTTQHMGVNLKGNCALSPQEALFLLEKGLIEVEHNNFSLSIEEAYSVMLKGKLSVEKYEVYSFLSLQGFIVVHHQSRIGPSYNELMNLEKKKHRKRKATDGVSNSPEMKRLTFSGVLASNAEINAVNAESSTLSNDDSVLNTSDSQKVQLTSQDTLNNDQNIVDSLHSTDRLNLDASITVTPDSTNRMESNDSEEKGTSEIPLEQASEGVNVEMLKNDNIPSKPDNENSVKTANSDILNNKQDQNKKVLEEMVIENTNEDNEIDIENSNDDDDTNEVIIEDDQKLDKNDDINVDESLSDYFENDNFEQTDESIPDMCEETSEKSLDVYSCSPGDNQSLLEDLNSDMDNVHSGPSKEHDDDVTLVEVKKKEKKPLAVIDLLSDDDEDDNNDDFSCAEQKKKSNKSSINDVLSTEGEQAEKKNGEEMYEDSDDEIQVLKVCPVPNNNPQLSSRNVNCIKSESRKLKIPISSANIKSSFRPQMKFPDLCKKDIICLPRPPPNLLPNHVQPAKEAYVINYKSSLPKQGRVWNSYRDMQEYQRERRRERHSNSLNPRPGGGFQDFRSTNDSFLNQMPQFSGPEDTRDFGFDRNNQNFPVQFNRNVNSQLPVNHDRSVGLLRTPNVFNPPNQMPYMNIHKLQNLSSSNPVAFVNEIHKTVYSVASTMISSMLGQHLNPNNVPARSSPTLSDPMMGFSPHSHMNNFNQNPSPFHAPGFPGPMVLNPATRSDFHPIRFPPNPPFSADQYPASGGSPFMPENNGRPSRIFRPRGFPPPKGPLFPCTYRNVRKKRDWRDVKAAVVGTNASDSGSDIEEVPINLNQFLWSNDIQPLVKPGSKLAIPEVLKSLQITQRANLSDANCLIDRYMPSTPSLEISFDVYLPNSKYRRSAPSVPKCRIIVLKAADPIPRYSELVCLKKKWNDEASLQIAVVDHGDINFYSFNSLNVPEIIPFES